MKAANPPFTKAELERQRLRDLRDAFTHKHRGKIITIAYRYGARGARRLHAYAPIGTTLIDITSELAVAMGYRTNRSDGSLTCRGSGYSLCDLLTEYFPKLRFSYI